MNFSQARQSSNVSLTCSISFHGRWPPSLTIERTNGRSVDEITEFRETDCNGGTITVRAEIAELVGNETFRCLANFNISTNPSRSRGGGWSDAVPDWSHYEYIDIGELNQCF